MKIDFLDVKTEEVFTLRTEIVPRVGEGIRIGYTAYKVVYVTHHFTSTPHLGFYNENIPVIGIELI